MHLEIVPLAITMMAGPQILADVIFVTSRRGAVKVSLAFLTGIILAISIFITAVFIIARILGLSADATGAAPSWEHYVEIGLVILLIFLSLRSYMTRETAKPPKWISQLQTIKPIGAFKLAFPLIWFMPGDFIVMLTIGLHLAAHSSDATALLSVLPFLGVVTLLAGFPLLAYLTFRQRAEQVMPRIRTWMQSHSWLINIIIYIFFIVLITT